MSKKTFTKPSDEELQAKLSPLQYEVTQRAATEPPFRNPYWDNHEAGIYVDVATGEPLFSSLDKFESGTGWPSFTRPIEDGRVRTQMDKSHGMIRTEVVSSAGGSHLGHLFDDGPLPSRQRYCMNSASMRFIPVDRLEAEGYGEYRALFEGADAKGAPAGTGDVRQPSGEAPGCAPSLEIALLAGGCFWGMEDILRKVPGVLETEVGYMGGTTADPTYAQVSTGETGHAESIKVVFDPSRISYAELLEKWFFRMHDPTTQNRQGNDVGTQYRSAIFVTSDEQAKVAEEVKAKVQASGRWKAPIVTQIVKAGPFTKAEEYHQDYLVKHPGGYTCHFMRD